MNQINQEVIQKPSLPIKTKVAAWLIILIGVIILGYSIKLLFEFVPLVHQVVVYLKDSPSVYPNIEKDIKTKIYMIFVLILFLILFLFVLVGYLFKVKNWAWIVLFIISLIAAIFGIWALWNSLNPPHFTAIPSIVFTPIYLLRNEFSERLPIFYVIFTSFLIPLILFFLDRKNFWKIAT